MIGILFFTLVCQKQYVSDLADKTVRSVICNVWLHKSVIKPEKSLILKDVMSTFKQSTMIIEQEGYSKLF